MIDLEAGHSQIRDQPFNEVVAIMHQAMFGGRDRLLDQVEEGMSIQTFAEGAGMLLV
ncbi:hypothetical protein CP157_01168 [Paracoccus marcusii]|uniref:hypothetical protein n=1 Tax=Paracoccus marcusii TaxID=59779 RepID=UPI001C3DC79B|nr:hypothetical protein [Paracoccus marcusii]QXI63450.1 hypothetical protein CP157_01168 [Paracoccus marcusii]